ncbi:resolvase [Vibrio parahaemolyticus]|nr:recombinase family protein [Vibrio parahaemolyticus]ELB2242955.1 recombinase family protein [Vibrio parahaemolyticus]TOF51925.1 resolvase [Vibrio parahaemolyticus]HCE2147308.1 recombinase family protein [Vibrio parahaemolyticus]HCH1182103.1 recombinase family protein [Vibrio parahaemolyticus]
MRNYCEFLREAKRLSDVSVDGVTKAINRFEVYTKYKDFKRFHRQQAVGFKKYLVEHQLESGDMLVVLKLDRLGRDNIDVQKTITMLGDRRIKVVCLDLPVADLSSAEGKLMLQMFSAFAEFERNRIRERTKEGLERAKAKGKKLGRPVAHTTTDSVQAKKAEGLSQSKAAEVLGLGIATVKRHWNKTASDV